MHYHKFVKITLIKEKHLSGIVNVRNHKMGIQLQKHLFSILKAKKRNDWI